MPQHIINYTPSESGNWGDAGAGFYCPGDWSSFCLVGTRLFGAGGIVGQNVYYIIGGSFLFGFGDIFAFDTRNINPGRERLIDCDFKMNFSGMSETAVGAGQNKDWLVAVCSETTPISINHWIDPVEFDGVNYGRFKSVANGGAASGVRTLDTKFPSTSPINFGGWTYIQFKHERMFTGEEPPGCYYDLGCLAQYYTNPSDIQLIINTEYTYNTMVFGAEF